MECTSKKKYYRAVRLAEAVENDRRGAQEEDVLQPAEPANVVVGYDRQGAAQANAVGYHRQGAPGWAPWAS